MKNQLLVNKIKVIGQIIMVLLTLNLGAQNGENCTQESYSSNNLRKLQGPIDSTISPDPNDLPYFEPFSPYERCENQDQNLRGVGYIHGLGGSVAAWDKQIRFTDSAYKTACFGVDYGSSSYETSFLNVGQKVKNDLSDGFDNVDESHDILYSTERCRLDDYVIAHSQGGIAARYLDWQWNATSHGTFGAREFYGLVTFGTPHAGAHVALTQEGHYRFVSEVVSTVILQPVDEVIYDMTSSFPGTLLSGKVYDLKDGLDTLIKRELAPLMLSSVHQQTLDQMRPGSQFMSDLNNHWGKLHRVAFFGVEDAPECWRVMDQIVTKGAEEYPLWGAQPDETFMNKMEEVRAWHQVEIENNLNDIKSMKIWRGVSWVGGPLAFMQHLVLNRQIQNLEIENKHRRKSIEFLNNANTDWRFLIGSYHLDSFDLVTDTMHVVEYEVKVAGSHPFYRKNIKVYKDFTNLNQAQNFASTVDGKIYQKYNTRKVLRFYPSDGVVLAQSQKAFPGITKANIDFMPHNNHFQERNSLETERVLNTLYNGNLYDSYFSLKK